MRNYKFKKNILKNLKVYIKVGKAIINLGDIKIKQQKFHQ